MQTNLKSIKRYDTGRLVERTNKTSWVVLSLLAVVITICLGPACYTLGYVTASTASPFSPASNAFNDNVKDHARPTDSINALVQDANVTYILQNPCGQSVTEAKEHRCHYDMVEMAWVPLECYDAELEEELRAVRDWRFFRFVNRTGEMSWEDAQRGDFEYLTADWDCKWTLLIYRRIGTNSSYPGSIEPY